MAKAVTHRNSKVAEEKATKPSATAKTKNAGTAGTTAGKETRVAAKTSGIKTASGSSTKTSPATKKALPQAAAKAVAPKASAKKVPASPAKEKATSAKAAAPVQQQPVNRILITQPKPDTDKSPYYELARKYKLDLEFFPFIRVEGVSGRDFRRQRVDISEYTAIIFTSRSAVDHFFRILEEMKIRVSQEMKYCCITEAVALYLQKFILYRKRKVFFSADGSTQGLLDVIGKHKNEKYVVPTSESGKNEINQYLSKHSIPFAEVTLFHTVSNDINSILKTFVYDMIVFFSPFSVQTLLEHSPKFKQNGTLIGAFGPSTTKAIEELGLRLDVKAPAPNAPSMITALERYLEEVRK